MDAAAKERVIHALVEQLRSELASTQATVAEQKQAAEVDQDSSISVDDLSQADAAGNLTALFEESTDRQQADIDTVEALDVHHTDVVEPGALVGFSGGRYVVGATSDSFSCDGIAYDGISQDAPIYPSLVGLRVGDTFEFNGRTHTIDFVA